MKTIVKHLVTATIIALVMITSSANAEGNEKSSLINESIETPLEIENWMTDSNVWNVSNTFNITEEVESILDMQTWMINESTWGIEPATVNENENSLQLEDWMTNSKYWNF